MIRGAEIQDAVTQGSVTQHADIKSDLKRHPIMTFPPPSRTPLGAASNTRAALKYRDAVQPCLPDPQPARARPHSRQGRLANRKAEDSD